MIEGIGMIEEHTDPTAEAHAQASNLLRTLLTALATVADRHAQRHQASQERQRHQAEAERRETEKRMEAEREAAYLAYRRVYDENWWATVSPSKLAGAALAAGTWAGQDPRARDAWGELSEQLQARYGIDLEALARQADATGTPAREVASEVRGHVERARQAGQASDMARARRWEAEVLAAAGAELGAQVIAAKGWPRLQAHLDGLQAAGQDPSAGLSAAIGSDKLHGASDKAAVLKYRLEHLDKYQSRPVPIPARPAGKNTRPTGAEHLARRRRVENEKERPRDEPGRGGED